MTLLSQPRARALEAPGRLLETLMYPLGLGALAGVLALVLAVGAPPGMDVPAHLYETAMWRAHGFRIWDDLWYGGRYAQVSYSLLFYPLAALAGPAAIVAASAAGAATAFAGLTKLRWGVRSAWAAVAFALVTALPVLSGQYPFLLGVALALGALWALQLRRIALALALVLLSGLASPLALAFLVVPLVAAAATSPGWWRQRRLVLAAAGMCLILLLMFLIQRAFARDGARYPGGWSEAVTIGVLCTIGLLMTGRRADQRIMRAIFVVYALLGVAALTIPSPLGGNWVRLTVFMAAPLLLLPMAARDFRPRVLVLPVVVAALAWHGLYVAGTVRQGLASRSTSEAFWRPVEAFLAAHPDPDHRVEVVATTGKWEAYYLPRQGVPIARGWFRQDDWPQNAPLYDAPTPASYRAWLRDMGVRYVLLPHDNRDPSAVDEAALLGRGGTLPVAARLPGWTVYAVPQATPIATPADGIRLTAIDGESVTLRVARPGTYRLRLTYTPYWQVGAGACVAPRAPWGTVLHAPAAGTVVMRIDLTPGRVLDALLGRAGSCAG